MKVPSKCVCKSIDARIVVREKGRKLTLLNTEGKTVTRIRVDGCVVQHEQKSCDYLLEISEPPVLAVYIELKGKNLNRACEQLTATLSLFAPAHKRIDRRCHIVASRIPMSGASLNVLKDKFRRNNNGVRLYVDTVQGEISV